MVEIIEMTPTPYDFNKVDICANDSVPEHFVVVLDNDKRFLGSFPLFELESHINEIGPTMRYFIMNPVDFEDCKSYMEMASKPN
jgi:hypothetical protein